MAPPLLLIVPVPNSFEICVIDSEIFGLMIMIMIMDEEGLYIVQYNRRRLA
jgi:hypothetical protein